MTDEMIKKILSFVVRNHENLCGLLSYFNGDDLEKGILTIPERMINYDLKELILKKAAPYLKDYRVTFTDGSLFLDGTIHAKQLGTVHAQYMLTIREFKFQPGSHTLLLDYREDVKSEGSFLQGILMRAAGLCQGSFLMLAASLLKPPGISVGPDSCAVSIDRIYPIKSNSFLNQLSLQYLDSQDGKLRLSFSIIEPK